MPIAEEAVKRQLGDDRDIVEIVEDRIYPEQMTQGSVLPAIVYSRISSPRLGIMGGPGGGVGPRLQLNMYANTYRKAKELADYVRLCLDGRNGRWGDVDIEACILDDEGDLPPFQLAGNSKVIYGIRHDYILWHTEDIE